MIIKDDLENVKIIYNNEDIIDFYCLNHPELLMKYIDYLTKIFENCLEIMTSVVKGSN